MGWSRSQRRAVAHHESIRLSRRSKKRQIEKVDASIKKYDARTNDAPNAYRWPGAVVSCSRQFARVVDAVRVGRFSSFGMPDSYAQYRAVRFFGSLDGLRAFSIIGVVWFHSWWGTPYYPILAKLPVLRMGEYGVSMFYVVSG